MSLVRGDFSIERLVWLFQASANFTQVENIAKRFSTSVGKTLVTT